MIVCAHGEVSEYCKNYGLVICGEHIGDIEDYRGKLPVLVTDVDIPEMEFFALKERMLRRGVELVSTRYSDTAMAEYIAYQATGKRREKSGGRAMFGYRWANGERTVIERDMAVVRRIFELRDAGWTYKRIADDDAVCYADGRKLSISTVQVIIGNREKYGK